jgi:hypothetical protein
MGHRTPPHFATYVEHLRQLPFVREVQVAITPATGRHPHCHALVVVRTPKRKHRLLAEQRKTHLSYALTDRLLHRISDAPKMPWIVLAPYIGPAMGRYLGERGLSYVDLAGNLRLALGDNYLGVVEGRKAPRRVGRLASVRSAGYQVLFVLLADPRLAAVPIRVLAEKAGVGKTAAAEMMRRLEEEGVVGRDASGRRLLPRPELVDRFLTGYADVLRPRLLVGRYRTPEQDPVATERRLEPMLEQLAEDADLRWAWGGGAAAVRLRPHYRGEATVLHVEGAGQDLARRLGVLPASNGSLTILRTPGPLGFAGVRSATVHPLLAYAELMASGDERAREAAAELRADYLPELP